MTRVPYAKLTAPGYRRCMVRTAWIAVIAVVGMTLALTGCAANNIGGGSCVPRMRIEPATIHPGDSITVASADKCNVKIPGEGWDVVAGHAGGGKALVHVKSSDPFDGSFRVELTLPHDFPVGQAYAGVDNWDYSTCPDAASCAGPMSSFTVVP